MDQDPIDDLNVRPTKELSADLAKFRSSECSHSRTEIRRSVVKGGSVQFRAQCLSCGQLVSNPVAKKDLPPNVRDVDLELRERKATSRQKKHDNIYRKHARIQDREASSFWKKYDAYLETNEWKSKRQQVLERAHFVCEGCREQPATTVHHLTYAHVFDELLFELVALCAKCHDRCHTSSEQEASETKDGPCSGCRHDASGDPEGDWCARFNVLQGRALSAKGKCGPDKGGYEPLK